MKRGPSGRFEHGPSVGGEKVKSFLPDPLPPSPALEIDEELREEIDQAHLALGRLDSVSSLLPDTSLFLYMYVRKEAVLSSQIEGTQSSLSDLLLFEVDGAPGAPIDDVREVSNYVDALEHGVHRIKEQFPISGRLLREIHKKLLSHGRGSEKLPGEYRSTQNWIGGSRPGNAIFIPPAPESVQECMSALEKFIHNQGQRTPTLLKAALIHVQFETIHPFLDGNGRLGRLLSTLLLVSEGVLQEPLLYPSLYLKTHREEYYRLLQLVRTEGAWEEWISFFIRGVKQTANQAVESVKALSELIKVDQAKIQEIARPGSALQLHNALQRRPILTLAAARKLTGLTAPTIAKAIAQFESMGIVRELTGKQRNRVFAYDQYMSILSEGTNTPI